ncbi:MAG TPA: transcriptional regulator BetI [Dongiaceae bacterium]|nr:transcriptional regulator BetI [Dongiaceae bacterium]
MARDALKEARKVQLMEATIDCIAARGFAELTLADVAKAAGLSVGIVNFYFRSKDVLLIETLRHLVAEYIQQTNENIRSAGPSAAAQVEAMIESDFHRAVANRKRVTVWYAFWGETRWRPEFLKICQQLSDSFHHETRQVFARLVAEGGYANVDADLVARGFDAMIDGLWLDMLINPKAVDREAAKQVVRTYLAGIFPNEFGRQSTGGAAKAATA